MKLILSRKGFDSSYGGMPSPILPDGRIVPLPIPSRHDPTTLNDAFLPVDDLGALLAGLRGRKANISPTMPAHIDPVLERQPRTRDWRPSLGQTGAAAGHLQKQNVGKGDVFLFFGWFRRVAQSNGGWVWEKNAPDIHLMFGWLEIAEIVPVVTDRSGSLQKHPWLHDHPHVASPDHYTDSRNAVYIGASKSSYLGKDHLGGGRFTHFDDRLQLTAKNSGGRRSQWSLPKWFLPNGRTPLTYNRNPERWQLQDGRAFLNAAARGQEFVLDTLEYPEAELWADEVVRTGAGG